MRKLERDDFTKEVDNGIEDEIDNPASDSDLQAPEEDLVERDIAQVMMQAVVELLKIQGVTPPLTKNSQKDCQ